MLALRPLRGCSVSHVYRALHSSTLRRNGLTNMLADSSPPAIQVQSITSAGQIELSSGLLLSGACIFLGGKVFLWDVPQSQHDPWEGWGSEQFEIFDVVVPKPGILLCLALARLGGV
jgi:NADH dehydrogenase [ubiquinone] 1 alpha subcomplex assembly factor 3